ncbi:MAG: DUF1211 domain-containing protein [Acidisphaera sp.]|nr:DUF1211 domain-containing protein [Acidisphaera sp.]MBV9812626.1 DUF1211 domain-containing protein [Acetobacteraceae bacterium]
MHGRTDAALPRLTARHLANLSDTIFGVAMTLLATTLLPSVDALTGSALQMLSALRAPLTGVALSFGISALYWMSQHRRLLVTDELTSGQIFLHLLFLLLIVLLPLSTELAERSATVAAAVVVYGLHLTLIAALNLALWIGVRRQPGAHTAIMPSALAVVMLAGSVVVGETRPELATYFWYATLALPLLSRIGQRFA